MLRRATYYLLLKRPSFFIPFLCIILILHCNTVSAQYVEGFRSVASEGKYGFIDESGEMAVPAIYDEVQDFREGHAFVRLGKWGEIDSRGEVIIPVIYDSIRRFSSGAIVVRMDNKLGLLRKDGKEICPITSSICFS